MSSDWVAQLRLKDTEKWTQHNGNTDWRTEPEVFLKTGKSEKKRRKSVLKGCEFKLNMWKTWGFNPTNAIGFTIINSSRKETWNSDALATLGLFLSLLFAPSARPVQDPQWQKALQPARTHQGRLRSYTLNVSFSKTLKLHLSGCSSVSRKVDLFCGSSSIWRKNGNKLLCMFYCCKSNPAVWIQCLLLSRLPLIQDDTFISHLAMRTLMESTQGKKLKQGIDMGHSQGLIIIFCSRECFYFVFSLPFSDLYWKVWLHHNLPAWQRGTMSKWPAAWYGTASSLAEDNNRSEKMMSAQNGDKVWSFSQNLHLVSGVVWRF